jgi:hypothetical protein
MYKRRGFLLYYILLKNIGRKLIMARTHTFKGSASAGYGYAAFIEDGQLVITEDWGREGGVLYRGCYPGATYYVKKLQKEAPKLFNSITQYYAKEAKKEAAIREEAGVTYRFEDSCDAHGNGYSGCIKNGQLVLEYDDPRSGGCYFRGSYDEAVAAGHINELKFKDPRLYADIEKYFIKHGVKDETEKLMQKYSFDEETKTILFKVKLHKKNRVVHKVLVRGRFQADVIKKLLPPIPEVLTLQTPTGDVFAIRSDEISAVEFVDEFSTGIELREV